MADSHILRLKHAAVADGCGSVEMGNFLFFRTAHFCHSRMHQMQLVLISLKVGSKSYKIENKPSKITKDLNFLPKSPIQTKIQF